MPVLQLTPGFRALDAGNGQTTMEMADACLVAGDAGAHVFDLAAFGLAWHRRIADQRPGHAAHISLAAGQDQLGFLGLVDAPGDEQGDSQLLLEGASLAGQVRRFDGHRRHDMDRATQRGRGTGDDMQVVELALQGHGSSQ
ncbi:hypothetical protein D3C80_605590 [compost metagenome]